MKILLSPAKKMQFSDSTLLMEKYEGNLEYQTPYFLEEVKFLVKKIQRLPQEELADMMKLSQSLARVNFTRYQDFFDAAGSCEKYSRPALFLFAGDVYRYLDIATLKLEEIKRAGKDIVILSGLYGLLRGLDLLKIYRLEMGTSLKKIGLKNLYRFWQEKITERLSEICEENEMIINLASQEYAKIIYSTQYQHKIIDIEFRQRRDGKLLNVGVNSKKARGLYARFLLQNEDITDLQGLKTFKEDGYQYCDNVSSKFRLVFAK